MFFTVEPAFGSDDRSMNLHNEFQQVHGKVNYPLYLLFWVQARPRRFSFKSGLIQMLIHFRETWESVPENTKVISNLQNPWGPLPEVYICTCSDSILEPACKWLMVRLLSREML